MHANIAGFVDYVAARTIRDVSCSLAGDRTFSGNLGGFTGPCAAGVLHLTGRAAL